MTARRRRLIIWGPGEVGGQALRAAHASGRFEIVGVKVWSPHKDGKDAGELVGIGPIGVTATRSRDELLALDADCAIVTPQPRAVLEGLDDDVIALLESGKSVVSTAAYHDVAMANWFTRARSPTQRLREIAHTPGAAASAWERWALAIVRACTSIRALDAITDVVLRPIADRRIPARATPARLLAACEKGGSALHGTGVHPTFMVERLVLRLCRALSRVSHIRFIEAGDFSLAPEGMWGGLAFFGFGRDPRELGDDWVVAKAGDFYYGDLIGNVAHALYGARPDEVRVERSLRGIPAGKDLQVGSTLIRAGTTATLHMIHRGYLGAHLFFTNEECWYLGAENACWLDDLPFGRLLRPDGHAFVITGEPSELRGRIAFPVLRPGAVHPITAMSVHALLDAVEPVCRAAPGIIIDDARTGYRLDDGASAQRARSPRRPYRVALSGPGAIADALLAGARGDAGLELAVASPGELLAADADCVVVLPEPGMAASDIDALLLGLLATGKNVVSAAADELSAARLDEACRRGGASIHRVGLCATLMLSRVVMTLVRGLDAVHHIRIIEARNTSSPESPVEDGTGNLDHVIARIARDLYAAPASDVRIERTRGGAPSDATWTIHRAYIGDRHFMTCEQLLYEELRGPMGYSIQIRADPADLISQWELGASDCARMILEAIAPVCEAAPGVLLEDASPRYQRDDRI